MSELPVDDLRAGYEALRAEVLGGLPSESPRGMAVVLTHGLPAWIRAWAAPPSVPVPQVAAAATGSGLGGEMVRLLAEMVLGGGRRLAIP